MKRFFCHFLSLREERADGESRLGQGSRETAVGAAVGWRARGSTLGARFTTLFYVHLNQTASHASVDLSFRGSVFQLLANSDSSPKVYFKIPEFIWLSFQRSPSVASLLSTKVVTIIIKDLFSIEFLRLLSFICESKSSRNPLLCNLSLLPPFSPTPHCSEER